jgi:hypothetical protein
MTQSPVAVAQWRRICSPPHANRGFVAIVRTFHHSAGCVTAIGRLVSLSPVQSAFNLIAAALIATVGSIALIAQVPGQNVNMVSGTTLPDGDPFLQRQNEPSIAVSTRNPQHLLAGSNDYRTVDLPGLPDDAETGDAWLGVYKSTDAGQTWRSTLLHGYPQDSSPNGFGSPLHGFAAASDPTVRAGANGLFFYSGIAFDRGDNAPGAVFVARFSDDNNKENGDPFSYLGTTVVAKENNAKFLDKPWLAVDEPRGDASCTVNGHRVAAGAVYLVYTVFNGPGAGAAALGDQKADKNRESENGKDKSKDKGKHPRDEEKLRGRIMFSRSSNCGATWSKPTRISSARDVNQGATIAIDPSSGAVYVAWRQFADAADGTPDAFMVAHSRDGRQFEAPLRISTVRPFDQGTTTTSFRTTAFPTMTIDISGRVYVAWAARGFAADRSDPATGDSRIVMSMSIASDGAHWSAPRAIDDSLATPGHQIMPALAYAAGRLQMAYYDLREDVSRLYGPFVDDLEVLTRDAARDTTQDPTRHTVDVRSAQAIAGPNPVFRSNSLTAKASDQVSRYLHGSRPGAQFMEQMDFNPPNLPLFKLGTAPFLGDYIDVAPSPAFVLTPRGRWVFNTSPTNSPVFHVAWTDNRDVRPPRDGNWAHYTPPIYTGPVLDPGHQAPACSLGQTGMRNQNVYTSQISPGLITGSPGNNKFLSPLLPRGFVVFARNSTLETKSYRLTVTHQPPGGRASFSQFPLPPFGPDSAPQTTEDVTVPPLSMAARTIYVTSSDPSANIDVTVTEVTGPGGPAKAGGQFATVELNPDNTNPAITNPDITNPAITNPAITNPDITNPAITNPDITNNRVVNPDITNPAITNPDIINPAITNPDITNPAITNIDIKNGSVTDVTWTVTNTGNTAAAFSTKLFLTSGLIPPEFKVQLVIYKTYDTPVAVECELRTESQTQLLVNTTIDPTASGTPVGTDLLDPDAVTFVVNPGEIVRITVRVVDPNSHDAVTFDAAQQLVPAVQAQAVNSDDAANGVTESPLVTPPSTRSLAFVVEPSATTAGAVMIPPVRVRMLDVTSAPVPGELVTLTLNTNPWGGSLAGMTTAITDSNGVATFSTLSLTVPGTAYQLTASAPAGPLAISQPFTITELGLIGIYDVSYLNNASGCGLGEPNPFNCSYLSGPVLVDPATTPPGDYRIEILEPLDPVNVVSGLRVWDGNTMTGVQHFVGEVFHHVSGQVYLYTHDWVPSDKPLLSGPATWPNGSAPWPVKGTGFTPGGQFINHQKIPNLPEIVGVPQTVSADGTFGLGFGVTGTTPGLWEVWAVDVLSGLSSNHLFVNITSAGNDPPNPGWRVAVYRVNIDPPAIVDAFETAAPNAAWTIVNTQFGNIGLSTAQNTTPGGLQSLALSSTSGGQRWIILERDLGGLTHGTATINFYDTAPGAETLYTNFSLVDSTTGLTAILGTQDFDAFCYKAMVYDPGTGATSGQNANCGIYPRAETSSVARTLGWHTFSIQWDSQTVVLSIDNQQVFQMAGAFNFDTVHVDLSGPDWRPNATYYFDDFSIRP